MTDLVYFRPLPVIGNRSLKTGFSQYYLGRLVVLGSVILHFSRPAFCPNTGASSEGKRTMTQKNWNNCVAFIFSWKILLVVGIALNGCINSGCSGVGNGENMMVPDAGISGDDAPPFTSGVSTLSGAAEAGFVDGPRGTARFANPVNVVFGANDMLYVADFDNGKIRIVDPSSGETSTLIQASNFHRPFGMAFASGSILYVTTDMNDNGVKNLMSGTVWRIDVNAKTATVIARDIGRPRGIVALPDGRLVLSDYVHHVIQFLDPATGVITPLAGTWDVKGRADSPDAKFSAPYGMALLQNGKLVVADFDNHQLRLVGLDGNVQTLAGAGTAGFADGSLSTTLFNNPQGVSVATNGDIFVTDTVNYRIRRIRSDTVDTVAGNGQPGFLDNDDRLAAELFGLEGISLKPDGSALFVADGARGEDAPYNRVRIIKMN
jgi:sugar lactone lactonase YvrE